MRIRTILFVPVLVALSWGFYGASSRDIAKWLSGLDIDTIAQAGAWGDSFGAFNALLSTAAFAVVFATLLQQVGALKKQNEDQHRQRFESSFFELLKLLRDLRSQIAFDYSDDYKKNNFRFPTFSSGGTQSQQDSTASANREIHYWLAHDGRAKKGRGVDFINIYMHRVHSKNEATIAPFFRMIYTMLDRIRSDNVLTRSEKTKYANLLRSQLTSSDILLMAINALSPVAADLSDMIIEFHLLKYLPKSSMKSNLELIYPAQAFAGRDPKTRKTALKLE